jgi:hypothetical protein
MQFDIQRKTRDDGTANLYTEKMAKEEVNSGIFTYVKVI